MLILTLNVHTCRKMFIGVIFKSNCMTLVRCCCDEYLSSLANELLIDKCSDAALVMIAEKILRWTTAVLQRCVLNLARQDVNMRSRK